MNIQRKNSAHHFRMQSEREQTFRFAEMAHSLNTATEKTAPNRVVWTEKMKAGFVLLHDK